MTTNRRGNNRAVRLHLTNRLRTAQHAADLLSGKEQALQHERARLEGHADRTRREWEARCRHATACLTRARVLGAGDEIRALIERGPPLAAVNANWQTSMGTIYPGAVDCSPGTPSAFTCTAAIAPTVDAFRQALTAGATHAATTTALRRLDTELTNTRRRRRAIGERLVPRLERVLHDLDLQLDEQDREEAIRVQIANRTHEKSSR